MLLRKFSHQSRLTSVLALALFLSLGNPGFSADLSEDEVSLRFQGVPLGTRVVLEFTARPGYQVQKLSDRVVVSLQGSYKSVPFKSKNFDEPIVERFKLDRNARQTDLLFFTGPEFVNVSSFEMNAPFRLIFAYNPLRINQGYVGPATGSPFFITEPKRDMKFTVGRTF